MLGVVVVVAWCLVLTLALVAAGLVPCVVVAAALVLLLSSLLLRSFVCLFVCQFNSSVSFGFDPVYKLWLKSHKMSWFKTISKELWNIYRTPA